MATRVRFKVAFHDTDVTTATAVPILDENNVAITVGAGDRIELDSATMIALAADADVHLFCGLDATPGTGETVLRGGGTNALTPTLVGNFGRTPYIGAVGCTLFAETGGAVVVDIVATGTVRRAL